jgi:hypothetical protein
MKNCGADCTGASRLYRNLLYMLLAALSLLITACGAGGSGAADPSPSSSSSGAIDIEPMTQVDVANHTGYFGDPYPVHFAQWMAAPAAWISGTTEQELQCALPVTPGCFASTPLTLTVSDALQTQVQASGNVFGTVINRNVYQTLDGSWQMAVTLYVHAKGNAAKHWTVIAHASPADGSPTQTPPTSWVADTILVGSLSTFDYANYDGKYFEDNGALYLLYSKRLISTPVKHDGIVAQQMVSPTVAAASAPVTLLAPDDTGAGFTSEYFHTNPAPTDTFKLIETGNITKIAGKYVMAYSAGDYQQADYKTGIAYSDTLIPQAGQQYRKLIERDDAGVWGQPGQNEVHYVLQSQKPNWPDYVGDQVLAPGVPAIVQQPNGQYIMTFDGFLDGDTPTATGTTPPNPLNIEPDHRRPFYVPLNVNVPTTQSVNAASDDELATWITPGIR